MATPAAISVSSNNAAQIFRTNPLDLLCAYSWQNPRAPTPTIVGFSIHIFDSG
jgi:hypothetical protein